MSKFAWPFRKFAEAMPPAHRPLTKERNAHPPAVAISKHPQRDKPRPARLMWTQLILRTISLTANLSAIIIAIFVSVGPTHRAWPVVFISASVALLINTFEVIALLRSCIPAIKIPRIHPIALILLDLLAIGVLIWSFLILFLEVWNPRERSSQDEYDANPFNTIEMWLAVTIGVIHGLLFIFDCIDCCSSRSPNSRVNELNLRRKRRGPSRVGDDVFEMDWG